MAEDKKEDQMCDYECGDVGDLCEEICEEGDEPGGMTEITENKYHSIWSDNKNKLQKETKR